MGGVTCSCNPRGDETQKSELNTEEKQFHQMHRNRQPETTNTQQIPNQTLNTSTEDTIKLSKSANSIQYEALAQAVSIQNEQNSYTQTTYNPTTPINTVNHSTIGPITTDTNTTYNNENKRDSNVSKRTSITSISVQKNIDIINDTNKFYDETEDMEQMLLFYKSEIGSVRTNQILSDKKNVIFNDLTTPRITQDLINNE